MADDLRREARALIQVGWWRSMHVASMPYEGRVGKGEINLTIPMVVLFV